MHACIFEILWSTSILTFVPLFYPILRPHLILTLILRPHPHPHLHRHLSSAQYRTNCYELFGCDVILDAQLNPYLLEVNVSPSLMGSSPLDKKIKGLVIADTLHIVGMYPHDPDLLRRYNNNNTNSTSGGGGGGGGSGLLKAGSFKGGAAAAAALAAAEVSNPFAFSSLSKLMASQGNIE
jgi:hypothetical protein